MDPRAGSMHNHGSIGRAGLEFHRVIHGGRDSMQFPRWIPGDLVGVPSSDQRRPGRKSADVGKHWLNVCRRRQTLVERRQTPGRDSMHNHGSMVRKYAQPWIPGPEVCTTMDPWASMMHNHGSMGRDSMQFPQSIPWGPGMVGAAGRDSSAQPWIHGGQHDADVGKPGRLKESLSTVCTVPIGGDR